MPEVDAPPHGGGGVGAILTKKIGPLPLWAYAVAGGGIGYYILRRRKAAAATQAASQAQGPSAQPTPTMGSYGYSGGQSAGYDNASLDSAVQQFQGQLNSLQTQIQALQGSPLQGSSGTIGPSAGDITGGPPQRGPGGGWPDQPIVPPTPTAPVQGPGVPGAVTMPATQAPQNIAIAPVGTSGGWLQYVFGANPWQEGLIWSPELYQARGGQGGAPAGYSATLTAAQSGGKTTNYA